jgi:6-phosphogluconolactonase
MAARPATRSPLPPAPPGAGPEIAIAADLAGLAHAAAGRVAILATAAIAARGRFRLALAGGSTPRAIYQQLATWPGLDWTRIECFFGDERTVPPEDAQSNFRMARETLLDVAQVPASNVHRLPGEASDLDAAARAYEATLRRGARAPWLDLALLGLGGDGHTASLFPETTVLDERQRLCAPVEVPQLTTRRLTLTPPVFEGARDLLFLIAGADKAARLHDVLFGPERPRTWPAQPLLRRVRPRPALLYCDRDAASQFPSSEVP